MMDKPLMMTMVMTNMLMRTIMPMIKMKEELDPNAQCVHWTVFFPFDRERWDTLSNLETVILLNIYLSQRSRSKGTMRKLDFREPQTLNL